MAEDDDAILFKSVTYEVARFSAAEGDKLSSMDDFPYYARFYEQTRQNVQELSKLQLVSVSTQILDNGTDVKVSARRLSILATYLEALCRSSGRCTPTRVDVVAALTGSLPQDELRHAMEALLSTTKNLSFALCPAIVAGWRSYLSVGKPILPHRERQFAGIATLPSPCRSRFASSNAGARSETQEREVAIGGRVVGKIITTAAWRACDEVYCGRP